ncbi:hypothetical protein AEAC466_16175 [Asticcacaulis sp. AC466]|uniref:ribonuclease E/G n=1 Tax=Asticcacaulis sp. AC466 TaxID=1282362 RepID=UPI0003C3C64F|nr:ribonuclease E/G [Asticcacaulis sp. AC466]ESQ82676.1 hypothetical protein AEAC466_16175 [Asticcacaulis sp. AC466]
MKTLAYDSRFSLARAAILVDGRPHFYLEGYDNDPALTLLGVRSVARLRTKAGGIAFLRLADGAEAVLDAPQEAVAKIAEGAALEVEIIAEARLEKRTRARLIGVAQGEPRRVTAVRDLKARLLARVDGPVAELTEPDAIADALDDAEEGALNPSGPLPEGGFLSVERTRALIACDVDSVGGNGVESGVATPRAFAKACNERAANDIGRRLRLSGLAGLVVMDLIGKRHDADTLRERLLAGLSGESIIVAPIGKFGTLEFVRPWSACPLIDADPALRMAHRLLRDAVKRAADQPGRLMTLRAPPSVLDIVRPLLAASHDPLSAIIRLDAAAKPEVIL